MEKLSAKKSLGQHFLNSAVVPKWMCDAANIKKGDLVVEIGPGTGVLTKEILARGAKVVALETDPRAITILEKTFTKEIANQSLTIIHTDVRTFDPDNAPWLNRPYLVVANIPYYLSGLLFRTFLTAKQQPNTLVYLVQKEVAKRATSSLEKGDKESLLSLSIQAYGTPSYLKTVGRGHFNPPPKVDSAIIVISDISRKRLADVDDNHLFFLLHLGFGQKRKQLLGNLAQKYDRKVLEGVFLKLNIANNIRAEDLPLSIWLQIAKALPAHSTL